MNNPQTVDSTKDPASLNTATGKTAVFFTNGPGGPVISPEVLETLKNALKKKGCPYGEYICGEKEAYDLDKLSAKWKEFFEGGSEKIDVVGEATDCKTDADKTSPISESAKDADRILVIGSFHGAAIPDEEYLYPPVHHVHTDPKDVSGRRVRDRFTTPADQVLQRMTIPQAQSDHTSTRPAKVSVAWVSCQAGSLKSETIDRFQGPVLALTQSRSILPEGFVYPDIFIGELTRRLAANDDSWDDLDSHHDTLLLEVASRAEHICVPTVYTRSSSIPADCNKLLASYIGDNLTSQQVTSVHGEFDKTYGAESVSDVLCAMHGVQNTLCRHYMPDRHFARAVVFARWLTSERASVQAESSEAAAAQDEDEVTAQMGL